MPRTKGFAPDRPGFIATAGQRPKKVRPHGTYAKYVIEKCHCFECRVAHSRHVTERDRNRLAVTQPWRVRFNGGPRTYRVFHRATGEIAGEYPNDERDLAYELMIELNLEEGQPDPVWASDGELAQMIAHMRKLHRRGVSWKAMARAAGMSSVRLLEIVDPRLAARRGKPVRRVVRRKTYERLMAVDFEAHADGGKVDPAETQALTRCLLDAGIPKNGVASAMLGRKVNSLQNGESAKMTGRTRRRIRALHDATWFVWGSFRDRCSCTEYEFHQPPGWAIEAVKRFILPRMVCSTCGYEPRWGSGMSSHVRRKHGLARNGVAAPPARTWA